ncbi:MAG: hypothetical protein SNJ57_11170 [Cyanobacteriota bacterium]
MDELRAALELATEEELEVLTEILFCRKLNPLDYVYTPDPVAVCSQERDRWLTDLEQRFRFLAADGMTVLRGKTRHVTYRQVLIQICRYLRIPYSLSLSTAELEAEIFLTLLQRAWQQLPPAEQRVLNGELQESLSHSDLTRQLPPSLQTNPSSLLMKGGSALAVSAVVRPWLLQLMARQFTLHAATYQAAKQAGGAIANQVAVRAAYRGMAASAARYGAVRSVLSVLGPALWAWFFADLGWRAIATNYARVIPVVFTLAQIRLIRAAECPA